MEEKAMKKANLMKAAFAIMIALTAVVMGGCGGRGGGQVASLPPANTTDRGTLKFTNVTTRTAITIDAQQIPAASGTVTVSVAPGIHTVVVSRAGYIVGDIAGLAQTPIAINETTEKALSFTREAIPLPDGWVDAAGRIAGAPVSENIADASLPLP
jgi:hypothetical protein